MQIVKERVIHIASLSHISQVYPVCLSLSLLVLIHGKITHRVLSLSMLSKSMDVKAINAQVMKILADEYKLDRSKCVGFMLDGCIRRETEGPRGAAHELPERCRRAVLRPPPQQLLQRAGLGGDRQFRRSLARPIGLPQRQRLVDAGDPRKLLFPTGARVSRKTKSSCGTGSQ